MYYCLNQSAVIKYRLHLFSTDVIPPKCCPHYNRYCSLSLSIFHQISSYKRSEHGRRSLWRLQFGWRHLGFTPKHVPQGVMCATKHISIWMHLLSHNPNITSLFWQHKSKVDLFLRLNKESTVALTDCEGAIYAALKLLQKVSTFPLSNTR